MKTVRINYTNWRRVTGIYLIEPTGKIEFTSTEWHPEPQWLLEAVDVRGGKTKMFALKDIHSWVHLKEAP